MRTIRKQPADTDEKLVPEPRAHVAQLTPALITINSRRYQLVTNHKDAMNVVRLAERYDEILNKYDYIVGDWGFEQLRLKGFYSDRNTQSDPDQRIGHVQDYLLEFCNFGCAYFIIERIDAPEKVTAARKPRRPRTRSGHPTDTDSRTSRDYNEYGTKESDTARKSHRPHRNSRSRDGNAPYAEKRTGARRPERGRSEQATTTGNGHGRHFTVRKTD